MSRMRVELRFGPTAPQRWTVWRSLSSGLEPGMSKALAIMKGQVITPSFSKTLAEIA